MVFVALSLILSWASFGVGAATAVVRKQSFLLRKKKKKVRAINLFTLAFYLLIHFRLDTQSLFLPAELNPKSSWWTVMLLVLRFSEGLAVDKHMFLDIFRGLRVSGCVRVLSYDQPCSKADY